MKLSQFRQIIKEEVRRVLKETQTNQVDIWTTGTVDDLKEKLKKLGEAGIAFTNVQPKSDKTFTAQFNLDKFIKGLNANKRISLGEFGKNEVGVYYSQEVGSMGVIAFILENLDANTLNILKKLITKPSKPTKQKNSPPEDFVDAIVDLASSGAGAATGLKSVEFTELVGDIKKSNQMSAVDKALTKYINSSEEGAFTFEDYEELQTAGFKMQGINYDNLS
jgi:hypothetical protein